MLLTIRLWFLWPLVCLLSALIASPFAVQIQKPHTMAHWIYLARLCLLGLACLFLLARAAITSTKSTRNPVFRRQGFIAP